MPLDVRTNSCLSTVCPHDCPSTCALEVERLAPDRIGKVMGAADNPYTSGVICAKVARYAERVHHPDRLTRPLRRVGEKGGGNYQEITWDQALDEVAEAFTKAEQRFGAETVWPYYYAGTMGHVQRDGIERLRHVKRYSRLWLTICTMLPESGWFAGVGKKAGVDAREIANSDLIVVWGGNPVSTQVNVMTHIAKARKGRGAKLVVVDPYRTGTATQADLHLMVKPGTDGALAAAVIHILLRDGHADRDYLARLSDWDQASRGTILPSARRLGRRRSPGSRSIKSRPSRRSTAPPKRATSGSATAFARARNGAANLHAVSCLPAVTGAWQVPERWRARVGQRRDLSSGQDPDRGPRPA